MCEPHRQKLVRIFTPKKKRGPKPGIRTALHIEQVIMTYLTKHGKGAPTPISLATDIPRWTIQAAMLRMLKEKKLIREGKANQATYRKA